MPDKRRGRSPRTPAVTSRNLPDLIPVSFSGLSRIGPPPSKRADRLAGSHLQLSRLTRKSRSSLWGFTAGLRVVITPSSDNELGWGAMCLGHIVVCNFRVRRWLGAGVYLVGNGVINYVTRLDEPPVAGHTIDALVIEIYRHDMAYREQATDLLRHHTANHSDKESHHAD